MEAVLRICGCTKPVRDLVYRRLPKIATNGSEKNRNVCYRHRNSENDFYKMYRCTLLHAECFFCSDFYENSGVRLLEEMWLLLGNTMSLLNSKSVGLKKNIHDVHIRTLLWDIRKYH